VWRLWRLFFYSGGSRRRSKVDSPFAGTGIPTNGDAEERTIILSEKRKGEIEQIKRHTCHTCLKPLWCKALRAVAFHGPNATLQAKRHTNATPCIRHSVRGIHRCHHCNPFLESPLYGAADGLWAGLWIPSGAVVDAADASGV